MAWHRLPVRRSIAIRLAANYSPQAAELLEEGRIQLDIFKCPAWPELIARARALLPVYVHFDLAAGDGDIRTTDWATVEHLLRDTSTPFVNIHVAPRAGADTGRGGNAALLERVIGDVREATSRFGPDRVILENVPYRVGGKIAAAAVDPEVLGQVVASTGCGFLLDIAHGRLTSLELDLDPREYLAALPLHALREVHVTGLGYDDTRSRLRDHMPMTDDDWELASFTLEQVRVGRWRAPWVVACEYGGVGPIFEWRSEKQVIAADLPRLAGFLGGSGLLWGNASPTSTSRSGVDPRPSPAALGRTSSTLGQTD